MLEQRHFVIIKVYAMEDKRIVWKQKKYSRGILAFNKEDEELGWLQLEKIGRHMHWCWYQNEDIRMSPGCLEEVREKQKEKHRFRFC